MMRRHVIHTIGIVALLSGEVGAQETAATIQLKAWSAEFNPAIIEVAPSVYTAVGYGASTLTMIVGDGGVVMVDTGSAAAETAQARDAFRRISTLPVRGIVYTHGHLDHTNGSSLFVDPGAPPEIWAHARFGVELGTLQGVGLTINRVRTARQFGNDLPPERRINNGISPVNYPSPVATPVPPNRTFQDRASIDIAGIKLELVANPGETDDQLYAWLPDRRVVFAGDNFYRCMPNLYAIRGTPYRDVQQWARAVDSLLTLDAEVLVGGHARPVVGRALVKQVLTDYRDAIRFIFDKTIEGMNRGLTPDELVDYVRLPKQLADKEYLQPYFGHPQWAVRSIFTGYLGWFDGNATNLFPLSPGGEAERVAKLAGGQDRLITALHAAMSAQDYQWAAQLSDYILVLDSQATAVKTIKARALEALAERTVSATARNYYLTVAMALRGEAR